MTQSLHTPPAASHPHGTPLAGGTNAGPAAPLLFPLPDEAATDRLGTLLSAHLRVGSVVGLNGELGAGKTRLARAVALAAGVAPAEIGSPTFTLVREYAAAGGGGNAPPLLFHLDAYRLADGDDLLNLGPEEFLDAGAVLIEWAERVADALPADRLTLTLTATGETSRAVAATAGGPDSRRMLDAIRGGFVHDG